MPSPKGEREGGPRFDHEAASRALEAVRDALQPVVSLIAPGQHKSAHAANASPDSIEIGGEW